MMILLINGLPVGCLTSNSLSETIAFINTCKTTAKGAITQLPTLYGYSIPFEAVMATGGGVMTYEDIRELGRNRSKFVWSMVDVDTDVGDAGVAFLENLELTGSSDDFIKFTGTLTGYGAIQDSPLTYNVWYQDVDTPVDEGGNYVLVQ